MISYIEHRLASLFFLAMSLTGATACATAGGPATRPFAPCCSLLATNPEQSNTRFNTPLVAHRVGPLGIGKDSIWSGLTFIPDATSGHYPAWDIDEVAAFDPRLPGGWAMRMVLTSYPNFGATTGTFAPAVTPGTVVDFTQDGTGQWSPRGNAFPSAGKRFIQTSVTAVGNRTFACATTDDNEIWLSEWDAMSGASGARREMRLAAFQSGAKGSVRDVACATVGEPSYDDAHPTQTLHVCAVTGDGHAWHLASAPLTRNGGEEPGFGAIEDIADGAGTASVGGNPSKWAMIDCAGNRGLLHVVVASERIGANDGGAVYRAITNGFGTWHQWEPIPRTLFNTGPVPLQVMGPVTSLAIGFCNDGLPTQGLHDVYQLNVAMIINGELYFTVRADDPLPWGPPPPGLTWVTLTGGAGGFTVTTMTLDLSGLRPPAPPSLWRPLESGQGRPGHATNARWGSLSISSRPFPMCRDDDTSIECKDP